MNTVFKVAAVVLPIAVAFLCFGLALLGLFAGVMASDAGDQWWSSPLLIVLVSVPTCLAFVALFSHGVFPEESDAPDAQERTAARREAHPASVVSVKRDPGQAGAGDM
jgi:hypothetical protein